jgi:hypothetical protein
VLILSLEVLKLALYQVVHEDDLTLSLGLLLLVLVPGTAAVGDLGGITQGLLRG